MAAFPPTTSTAPYVYDVQVDVSAAVVRITLSTTIDGGTSTISGWAGNYPPTATPAPAPAEAPRPALRPRRLLFTSPIPLPRAPRWARPAAPQWVRRGAWPNSLRQFRDHRARAAAGGDRS